MKHLMSAIALGFLFTSATAVQANPLELGGMWYLPPTQLEREQWLEKNKGSAPRYDLRYLHQQRSSSRYQQSTPRYQQSTPRYQQGGSRYYRSTPRYYRSTPRYNQSGIRRRR